MRPYEKYYENRLVDEDYDTLEFLGGPPNWSKDIGLEEWWAYIRKSRKPSWGGYEKKLQKGDPRWGKHSLWQDSVKNT
jgi:hypothetical protein